MNYPSCTVILTSYNNFTALWLTLLGYETQTYKKFYVIVSDDGSEANSFKQFVEKTHSLKLDIQFITQEDNGYQRSKVLNNAISKTKSDYLIMSDADVVPHSTFVENHLALAKPNQYVAGGSHVNIPNTVWPTLKDIDIRNGCLFDLSWLSSSSILTKKMQDRLQPRSKLHVAFKNFLSARRNAFVGNNSSAWREDLLKVNGFDESFVFHGSEDRDIGVRLANAGIKGKRYTYSLKCVHLDHKRPYVDQQKKAENRKKMKSRMKMGVTWVEQGITKPEAS